MKLPYYLFAFLLFLLYFNAQAVLESNRPDCIVDCNAHIPDKSLFRALSSSKPFLKNAESNINCFDPRLYCTASEIPCDDNRLPQASWYNQVAGGTPKLISLKCSPREKSLIEGDLPKGLFMGEGQFQIIWPGKSGAEHYFYKAISGE